MRVDVSKFKTRCEMDKFKNYSRTYVERTLFDYIVDNFVAKDINVSEQIPQNCLCWMEHKPCFSFTDTIRYVIDDHDTDLFGLSLCPYCGDWGLEYIGFEGTKAE